jgi:aminomethyltransferase
MSATPLLKTPLHALHVELGAKMVEFAGYEMPIAYPDGILHEHRHCRSAAALFDVSHMGQIRLSGEGAAKALESIMPQDIFGLEPGRQRYGFFTNTHGGILDDLVVTRRQDDLIVVVNAACKDADFRHITTHIGDRCTARRLDERALLALQGPKAAAALSRLAPEVSSLTFLGGKDVTLNGAACFVTRSGYTGEDGFEISVPVDGAESLARALLALPGVLPAGLGARDTLRLEAGLCLYGHDINETVSPVEAGLGWAIPKVRRPGGARAGHYPGAAAIESQLATGPVRKRAGLIGLERIPVREGAVIHDRHGRKIGKVTSGTIGPTINKPIAMAYFLASTAIVGHEVQAEVRDTLQPMRVAPMPFVPHRYVRG